MVKIKRTQKYKHSFINSNSKSMINYLIVNSRFDRNVISRIKRFSVSYSKLKLVVNQINLENKYTN